MQFSPDKNPRMAAALVLAAAAAAAAFFAALDAKAAEPTDDQIMTMMAIRWAGQNCGKMIPDDQFTKALSFTQALEPEKEAFAMRRIKFMVSKAANREIACISIAEALPR